MNKYSLLAEFVFNTIAFAGFAIDKWLAKRDRSRISEARLFQLAFIGPLGAAFGVWWIRHKTQKLSFLVRFVAIIVVAVIIHVLLLWCIHRWSAG